MAEAPISRKQKRGKSILMAPTIHLGRFNTREQAGVAYDRFVDGKSTEEVTFTLNYPKTSDFEREEALKSRRGTHAKIESNRCETLY